MHSHVWTICDSRIKTHARKDSRGRVSAEEEVNVYIIMGPISKILKTMSED